MKPLTVSEAARELKVTRGRILYLIRKGKVGAIKFGPVWQVDAKSLEQWRKGKPARMARKACPNMAGIGIRCGSVGKSADGRTVGKYLCAECAARLAR